MPENGLKLKLKPALEALNGGLFVSRGEGRHPHRTIDSYELILVTEGRLGMYEEEQTFDLGPGETLLLHPHRKHGGTTPYPAGLRFYWIHFRLLAGGGKGSGPEVPQRALLDEPERLVALFRRFLDDQASGRLEPGAAALLVELMLLEAAHMPAAGPDRAVAVMAEHARRFIVLNASRPISTADIAEALGCNPDHLGRVFRATCGHTVVDEIHRCRVQSACRQLLDSTANIDAIAAAAGFTDAHYFRRIFKRLQGMTPGAYRRLYGRVHVNTE